MEQCRKKKNVNWKRALKITAISLLTLVGVLVLGCFLLVSAFFYYPQKEAASAVSPTGRYEVEVRQTDGHWPFGPSDVTVIANERGSSCIGSNSEKLCETQIWDDGGKGSITIEWLSDDEVAITLRGSEQEDEILTYSMAEELD